ncbi:MAG: hypothetical protein NZM10_02385 [Fimbriimonadales bacterium]|nr:hypothetical protein [Fimbriimonadales bacterium]
MAGINMSVVQIRLSEVEWQQLMRFAEQRQCPPDELAREVLAQWLALDEQDWQARMDRIIHTFRLHTQNTPPNEIEREITAAFEEYRSECASS